MERDRESRLERERGHLERDRESRLEKERGHLERDRESRLEREREIVITCRVKESRSDRE